MRAAAILTMLAALAVAETADAAPAAQIAFVERRGLMEADAQCRLFTPDVRAALEAGALQASGALLRSGWTRGRLAQLEQAAIGAARTRVCGDARTIAAAAQARASFTAWAREPQMRFSGGARSWTARRVPYSDGWRLRQDVSDSAAFGVREHDGVEKLSLALTLAAGRTAPASVQLVMRDPARADASFIELPGRAATGLAAGAAPPGASHAFWARERLDETTPDGARRIVFVFPEAAFTAMLALDPREAVEARLGAERGAERLLIEVGDLNAARTFLALRAPR
jgi:hypothetical protein